MWIRLLLAFTLVPVLELWLLLRIGSWLGVGATVALVVLTGIAGATLARREGVHAWSAVQAELSAGRLPGRELLEALLVLLAGIVLVTPGVLTDAAGLLLLVRPLRGRLVRKLEERYRRSLDTRSGGPPTESRVIEI
ncbi:MAG: FxsA family protein [Gemmatimonadota bacterium]